MVRSAWMYIGRMLAVMTWAGRMIVVTVLMEG